MKAEKLPKKVFVLRRHGNQTKNDTWLEVYENLDDFADGDIVGIYELANTARMDVKTTYSVVMDKQAKR